jgi:hypothetical protein
MMADICDADSPIETMQQIQQQLVDDFPRRKRC